MNKKILWLASWYPSKIDPFNGDFIQRHAQAAALYDNIYVIKIVSDKNGTVTTNVKTEIEKQNNLTEHIVYFKKSSSLFGRIMAAFKGMQLCRQAIKHYIRQKGKPSLVHVHVAMNAGLFALWMKRKYKIHFIVTEHWAGFAPEAKENFVSFPFYVQILWKRVTRQAIAISTVSAYLGELLKKQFAIKTYMVIPNVVNTEIFYPINKAATKVPRFIHVSGLDFQKNPEAILEAFAILKKSFIDFHLDIFGPPRKNLIKMVSDLELQQQISFHNEVPQKGLAEFMSRSDALILYSRYESFGCVIIEANACGIPVLVSDLPVFHEFINQGVNGLFIKGDDPVPLAVAIKDFIGKKDQFDSESIAAVTASRFSYGVVGKQFSDWYESVVQSLSYIK